MIYWKARPALKNGAGEFVTGSFPNLNAVCDFLVAQKKNVILGCSAWKDRVNIEDALFAGSVINKIEKEFVKEGLRVFFISKNNRGYGNKKDKLFSINLENGKGSSFSLYKDIEKEDKEIYEKITKKLEADNKSKEGVWIGRKTIVWTNPDGQSVTARDYID